MRGFVPTPDAIVDAMVNKLFDGKQPSEHNALLDPGCGPGAFIAGVIRWCDLNARTKPKIVGYENQPRRHEQAAERFRHFPFVSIFRRDFLATVEGEFDFVIGNPPYVPITALSEREKRRFRGRFAVAKGRFDLYLLFFEQALRLLRPGGRLVFITPEKFLYVETAESLRRILAKYHVREIELVNEETFGELLAYPTITTVDNAAVQERLTTLISRDGSRRCVVFPSDGSSLQPLLQAAPVASSEPRTPLESVCLRVSCGVATGRDEVFVRKTNSLNSSEARYAFPTISGRELSRKSLDRVHSDRSMLIPYDRRGRLLPLGSLCGLRRYLSGDAVRAKLKARTCVPRKPWYAFHDSVPLPEMLRPKLLCKDITMEPYFWVDREGSIVPRHSVYYIVPRDPAKLDDLREFLNGSEAKAWLRANCQRAANGFLRLQSAVLKRLPVPASLAAQSNGSRVLARPAAGGGTAVRRA